MRDRHLALDRPARRAEGIVRPTRVVAYILWDRGHYVEVWGPPECREMLDEAKVGKLLRFGQDDPPPPPPGPASPSVKSRQSDPVSSL